MNRRITIHQRDVLRREAYHELALDVGFECGRELLATHAQTITDFSRLFDDLGWEECDGREVYELTMPDPQLQRIFGVLRVAANSLLKDDRAAISGEQTPDPESEEEARRRIDADLDFLSACNAVVGGAA